MRALATTALILAATLVGLGQERPNFTGRWAEEGRPYPSIQFIKHDGSTLVIRHSSDSLTYQLDGTEVRNEVPFHGRQILSAARAEWIGSTVRIVEATTYPDGRTSQSTQLWWLDWQDRLIAEVTETVAGQQPTTTTVVYRRADLTPPPN